MEILLPSAQQVESINLSRVALADQMKTVESPNATFIDISGSCSADTNRTKRRKLAAVEHLFSLDEHARSLSNVTHFGRWVGSKPRTMYGPTGLIHEPGGSELYTAGARELTLAGIALASEVMDESDYAIAGPWLTTVWVGTRNDADTGPRYLVRPTSQDLDRGIYPAPAFIKSSRNGGLEDPIRAINTIMQDRPVTRTRLTLDGPKEVTTHPNMNVGLILRGTDTKPTSALADAILEEFGNAREVLDSEFGKNVIPILGDDSHGHALWGGGGAEGQLVFSYEKGELIASGKLTMLGSMGESYNERGRQGETGKVPGLSITDECIGLQDAYDRLSMYDRSWEAHKLAVAA